MKNELEGKMALVTGASRGIGRATAIRLAKGGATVAVNYLVNESAARETAAEIASFGGRALLVKGDVSEEEDIEGMVEWLGTQWGQIDILVSNAASGGFRSLESASVRNFDAAMHTNVRSLMLLVQACLPWFNKTNLQKKVVALSSHGSHRALPDYGLIGASKAALESLVRHMAMEFGPQGINFNTVLAGLVATDSTRHIPGAETVFDQANARMVIGSKRVLAAQDVAESVYFLCTPSSDLVQGHTLVVDGGASLHM